MGLFHEVLNATHIDRSEARRPAWLKAPDRATPAAVDSERLLLGAVLLDPAQMLAVIEVLPPGQNWFYGDAHRLVYDAFLTLFERRDPIDLQTVTDVLYRRRDLEKVGGSVYLYVDWTGGYHWHPFEWGSLLRCHVKCLSRRWLLTSYPMMN